LTCLSCLGYGALKFAEKIESTSTARKIFGNNEFEIRDAEEYNLSAIKSLALNNYTFEYYFSSNNSQKSTKNPAIEKSQTSKKSQNLDYHLAHKSGDPKQIKIAEEKRREDQEKWKPRPTTKPTPANKSSQYLGQNRSQSMTESSSRSRQQLHTNNTRSKSMNSTTGLEQSGSRRGKSSITPPRSQEPWAQKVGDKTQRLSVSTRTIPQYQRTR